MVGERLVLSNLTSKVFLPVWDTITTLFSYSSNVDLKQEALPELIRLTLILFKVILQPDISLVLNSGDSTSRTIGNSAALHYNSKPQAQHHLRENHSAF